MAIPNKTQVEGLIKEGIKLVQQTIPEQREEFRKVLVKNANIPNSPWMEQMGGIFSEGFVEKLTKFSQFDVFLNYLDLGKYYLESYGVVNDAEVILGFSFGESEDVNRKLAEIADGADFADRQQYLQWEIAQLSENEEKVNKIELDEGENYMTTSDVLEQFLKTCQQKRVFVVAQSWHAPRCKYLCEESGLEVVGCQLVDEFIPNDPQFWVRDVLSWVLKESIAIKLDMSNH